MTWYKEGLHFKCTECGKCCTGSPGYVWVSKEEIATMALKLDLSVEAFCKKHTRLVGGELSLLEDPNNWDCVFLKDNQCTLYEARPKQCRTFPWWSGNLSSPRAWKQAAKGCEGIDHPDAPLVSFVEIQKHLED